MKSIASIFACLLFFGGGFILGNSAPKLNLPKWNIFAQAPAPTPMPEPMVIMPAATPVPRGSWMYDGQRKTTLDRQPYGRNLPPTQGGTIY